MQMNRCGRHGASPGLVSAPPAAARKSAANPFAPASCRFHRRASCAPMAASKGGAEQPLREWLSREGGYMHPALRLVDAAPCGCRGVIASDAIPLSQLEEHGPLVVVPRDLHLENKAALALLESWAGADAAHAAAEMMDSAWLVAVALTHERALGGASRWGPYLASLPEEPPSPWLLPHTQLRVAAKDALAGRQRAALGTGANTSSSSNSSSGSGSLTPGATTADGEVEQWVAAAEAFKSDVMDEAGRVCDLLREAAGASEAADLRRSAVGSSSSSGSGGGEEDSSPGGWLTPCRLVWALAHVQSRSLGTAGSSGLVPAIDLLNHSPCARPPMLQLDDSDRLVVTVLPTRDGEAVEMAPGNELLISYGEGGDPLGKWLKFGFVSQEWWHNQGGE